MGSFVNAGVAYTMPFPYPCTGAEGDSFAIPFPTPRADTNYVVFVALAKSAGGTQYLCNAPPDQYTTTGFGVITGTPVSAGDILVVLVEEQNQ